MDQSEIRKRLSRFLDGELPDNEIREIEELIKSDPIWQEEYNRMLSLQHIADRFELDADDDIWEKSRDKILSKIDADERLETEITEIKKSNTRGTIYKLVAVAASIALIAFISLYQFDEVVPNQRVITTPQMKVNGRNIPVPEKITDRERRALEREESPEVRPGVPSPVGTTKGIPSETELKQDKAKIESPAEIVTDEDAAIRKDEIRKRAMFDNLEKGPEQLLEQGDLLKKSPTKNLVNKLSEPAIAAPRPETAALEEPAFKEKKNEVRIRGGRSGEVTYEVDDTAQSRGKTGIAMQSASAFMPSDSALYVRAKARADSLSPMYFNMVSEHYAEIAAKRRQKSSPEEDQKRALEMASAFFEVGRLTGEANERKTMIGRLNELYGFIRNSADSLKIDEMIDSLRKIDE